MVVTFRRGTLSVLIATALSPGFSLAAEHDLQLENIEVIGITPLSGVGLAVDKIQAMCKRLLLKISNVNRC